jgi:hypothetical protein
MIGPEIRKLFFNENHSTGPVACVAASLTLLCFKRGMTNFRLIHGP